MVKVSYCVESGTFEMQLLISKIYLLRSIILGISLTIFPAPTPAQTFTAESPEEAIRLVKDLYDTGKLCYEYENYICALTFLEAIPLISKQFQEIEGEIEAEVDFYEWTVVTAKANAFLAYSEAEELTFNDKLEAAMRAQGLYELLDSKYQGERITVLGHAIYLIQDPCSHFNLIANQELRQIEKSGFQNEKQSRLFDDIRKLPNYNPNC